MRVTNRWLGSLRDSQLSKCLSIVNRPDRFKIVLMTISQVFINLLDLLAVAIVGALGAISINGIRSENIGNRVAKFLEIVHINNFSFQVQVAILATVVVSVLSIRTVLSIILTRKTLRFLANCGAKISASLISKLMKSPLTDINTLSTQETLFAVTSGISIITLNVVGGSVLFIADASLLIIMLTGLYIVSISLAISTALIFGLVCVGLYKFTHSTSAEIGAAQTDLTIRGNETILNTLNSYRELIVSQRMNYFVEKISKQRYELSSFNARLQFMPYLSKYLLEFSVIIATLLISAIQFFTQDATHAIATLAVFLAAGSRIAPAILRLQLCAVQIKTSLASSIITLKFIEKYKKFPITKEPISLFTTNHTGFESRISMSNICFTYPGANSPSLQNINLEINPGDFVAIAGKSGAGKSTLVDVLLGIYEPEKGSLTISGVSPREAFLKWPGAVAYVPQNIYLINDSIKANLSLGFAPESISDQIYKKSLIDSKLEFIFEAPWKGLDTQVGEDGIKLSGGQKQRLGIARAFITQPLLLVADEATSALDSETELGLADSIREIQGNSTVIMIAHRLSSIRLANKVVYMDSGKIEFIGTFEEVRKAVPDFDRQAQLMGL